MHRLLGSTILALALTARPTGLGRLGGAFVIASYLGFVATVTAGVA